MISRTSRSGAHPARQQGCGYLCDEVGPGQLLGGDVDRHGGVSVGTLHASTGEARLTQHPGAQGNDQAALLGDPDEVRRWQQTPVGVLPAHERLEATHGAGVEVDDRLVVEHELVLADPLLQLAAQREPLQRLAVQAGVVHRNSALAALLGPVHRHVRVAQHLLAGHPAREGLRDTDAGTQGVLRPTQLHRFGQRGDQPLGYLERGRQVRGLHQHGELVTAETGGGVTLAHRTTDPLAGGHQELVAHVVTEAVVDVLEVVEVQEQHDQRVRRHRPLSECVGQPVAEELPVGEICQRVVEGLVGELMLELLPFGHVAQGQHESADGSVGEQVVHGALERHQTAVLVLHRHHDRVLAVPTGQAPHEGRYVVGMHEPGQVTIRELARVVSEHGPGGRAHERGGAVGFQDGDQVGAVVDQRHQAAFTGVDDLPLGQPVLEVAMPAHQLAEPEEPADRDQHEQRGVDQSRRQVVARAAVGQSPPGVGVRLPQGREVGDGRVRGPGCGGTAHPTGPGSVDLVEPSDGVQDRAGVGSRLPGRQRRGELGPGQPLGIGVVTEVVDGREEPELREHDEQGDRDSERGARPHRQRVVHRASPSPTQTFPTLRVSAEMALTCGKRAVDLLDARMASPGRPKRGPTGRSVEDRAPLHQQAVQRLLDGLADLVGHVEHQHRVVGSALVVGVGADRLSELDEPLRR